MRGNEMRIDIECGLCSSTDWEPVPNMDQFKCLGCDTITDGRTLWMRYEGQHRSKLSYQSLLEAQRNQINDYYFKTYTSPFQFSTQSQTMQEDTTMSDAPKYAFAVIVVDEDDEVVYESTFIATGPESAIRKAIRCLDSDVDIDTVTFHTMQYQARI